MDKKKGGKSNLCLSLNGERFLEEMKNGKGYISTINPNHNDSVQHSFYEFSKIRKESITILRSHQVCNYLYVHNVMSVRKHLLHKDERYFPTDSFKKNHNYVEIC